VNSGLDCATSPQSLLYMSLEWGEGDTNGRIALIMTLMNDLNASRPERRDATALSFECV
jgi:hypothetical protein